MISVLLSLALASMRALVCAAPEDGAQKESPRVGADPIPTAHGTNVPSRKLDVLVLDAESGKPVSGAEVVAAVAGWSDSQPTRLTGEDGHYILQVAIPPEEVRKQMGYAWVFVQHPEYAGRTISWNSQGTDILQIVPAEVTMRMERGVTVGGTVKDERGGPLAGVKVLLGSSPFGFPMNTDGGKSKDRPYIQTNEKKPAAVTDAEGRWTYSHFPAELDNVEVTLIRPDGSREIFATREDLPLNRRPLISLDDLRAGKAETVLKEGVTVRGVVVDDKGTAVPNAQIKEGYGHGNLVRTPEFTSGAEGLFERPHRAPRQWIYTVSAPGRATTSLVAQVEPGMAPLRIVLPPAQPLRIRVVDAMGNPLPSADIRTDTYRNEGQILDWSAKTDSNGMAVWTNAPTTTVTFYATGAGVSRKFKGAGGDAEKRVELTKADPVSFHIRALDSATRAPVKVRKAGIRDDETSFQFRTTAEPNTNDFTVTIKRDDFRPGMYPSFMLKLEAEGYEDLSTRKFDFDEGNQELELALRAGSPLKGVVLQPGDGLAANAKIWMTSGQNGESLFCNGPGRFYGDRLAKAETDDLGKFELPTLPDETWVIFTHKSGFLQTTIAKLKDQPEFHLERLGRIEGHLTVDGKAKAGQRISLSSYYSANTAIHTILSTQSDSDGNFVFSGILPGEYKLYRQQKVRIGRAITESHQNPVTIRPGNNPEIEYGGGGRAVIGQATSDPPDAEVDWLNDDHSLVLKVPEAPEPALPNREDFATFAAFRAANDQARKSDARLAQDRLARTYVFDFDKDGSFRADEVPPGTYTLKLRLTKPLPQGKMPSFRENEEELGSVTREIVIPDGKEPFDLGSIVVPLRSASMTKSSPPAEFKAQSFDGRPVDLSQFRGKHVLLAFWAEWSECSRKELAEFQTLGTDLAIDKFDIVGVNIDEDLAIAQKAAKERGYKWQQTWLSDDERARITSAFEVEELPDLVLIDPDGRVIARDLKGERVRAALKRALNKKPNQEK